MPAPYKGSSCLTKKQRADFEDSLMQDFPQLDPYFVNILLDVYEKNPTFVEKLSRKHEKMGPPPPVAVETLITGAVEVKPANDDWPEQDPLFRVLEEEEEPPFSKQDKPATLAWE